MSHTSQLDRLRASAPAAASAAFIAGDPCFDRIVASVQFRARYRRALGIGDRTLVYVSSTWSENSALGTRFGLVRELLAELPRDSYAVAIALHPNISHRHGPGQVRLWYADCLRSGLIILPEIDGWRTAMIAADVVIGDSGSVTGYAAAINRPTMITEFPAIPDGTPISELQRSAPRLPPHGPYLRHIEAARTEHTTERFAAVSALVTSEPGRSLQLLRSLFYRILELPPPDCEPPLSILPTPTVRAKPETFADYVTTTIDGATVRLVRRPAETQRTLAGRIGGIGGHMCCATDYPLRSLRENADVLVGLPADVDDDRAAWLAATLTDHPLCTIVAIADGDTCTARTRYGDTVTLTGCPAAVSASALYAWIEAGIDLPASEAIAVVLGDIEYELLLTPCPD
ncbi:hypothetical protein [Nocardia cyriacigeorgica]|uniref:hypothetical protein n=1 Tax=Nocardia cyriacigeorgica TaxID=135487 RepID=UPI0024577ED3|nr:hypothetical protein [Nocardia cyriacigeorgica]